METVWTYCFVNRNPTVGEFLYFRRGAGNIEAFARTTRRRRLAVREQLGRVMAAIRQVSANGVGFTVLDEGAGPLALCLHGFPDGPQSFEPMLGALAAAGYRAVAPFMRGYAPTEIPADGRYQTAALGHDVLALVSALGAERAVVIGHDWGAAAAYAAAVIEPARISRLVTLAAPYGPGLFARLITDPVQQRRSWYMYLLTTPLGEAALAHDDFHLIDRLWADWSPGFEVNAGLMEEIKASFRQPGVATAAVSYYRHVFLPALRDPLLADLQQRIGRDPIAVPALYLQGSLDGCIGSDVETDAGLFSAGVRTEMVHGAGHFLHVEKPDEVNAMILEFLSVCPG
jgi:pimeloyl-ACP methyl ester carboxylesterase